MRNTKKQFSECQRLKIQDQRMPYNIFRHSIMLFLFLSKGLYIHLLVSNLTLNSQNMKNEFDL